MLDTGDPAPDFYLPAATDPDAEYMLSAAANAGPVVLAFVPSAEQEAASLLEALTALDWASMATQISVFGIGDDQELLGRLAPDLPFPLLYDPEAYVTDLYGIADRDSGVGPRRALVLADQGCTIRFAWMASAVSETPPLEDLVDAIQSL
ncbi:redoxin domain-containing protein [Halapricum salinum]|uniref:Alkyl hydroperoxide reductase n=1 Tax=Halapricum salinum TaxID=1457250 RepID=A0A4D6HAD4_9EURY|nr:redoxin domain-containing protein [Halapricum salinum]QCC49747.1 alkyl hydroperoxide reductase [Halapricum salinum]